MKRYARLLMLMGMMSSAQMIAADAPITIAVRPAVTVARATAQLKVLVERDDRNRVLQWEVDGPNYYRSSQIDLEGSAAPRSWFFWVKDMPEGDYDVRVTVKRDDKSNAVALSTIKVLPGQP